MSGNGRTYCVSAHQPSASAILAGVKVIDVRSWKTHYRGEIRIHATQEWDYEVEKLLEPWMSLIRRKGVMSGGIIGKATLVEIVPYLSESMFRRHQVYHKCPPSAWRVGLYGWVFSNPVAMRFVSAKGQQQLWRV